MRIATSLNIFEDDMPLAQMFHLCETAGFDAVDYNYTDHQFEFADLSAADELDIAKQVKAAADASGLPVVQMHGPIFPKFAQDDKARRMYDLSMRCFEFAAVIGCPWVVFEPDIPTGAFTPDHAQDTMAANVQLFRTFASEAAKHGTGIAIENVHDPRNAGRSFGATTAELIELVDTINLPNVGVCWDTGHAHLQSLDQRASLTALGARLVALHVADNDRSGDQHLLPFTGTIRWQDVMDGLRAAGYRGAFTYETHHAFRRAPLELQDSLLAYAVEIARHLKGYIT